MIKFENLKRDWIRSNSSSSRYVWKARGRPPNSCQFCKLQDTYFYSTTSILKISYSPRSQSVILVDAALYVRRNKNSDFWEQNTHFSPVIKFNSHYKLRYVPLTLFLRNWKYINTYTLLRIFFFFSPPWRLTITDMVSTGEKIGLVADLGAGILQFKLTWRDQKIEKVF